MKQFIVFSILYTVLMIVQGVWWYSFQRFREDRFDASVASEQMLTKKAYLLDVGRRFKFTWFLFILISVAFCFGYVGITIYFMIVSFFCLREFVSIIHLKKSDYWSLFLAFYVFLPIQYLFVLTKMPFLFYIFLPVYAFLLGPIITMLSGDSEGFFERAAKFQWAQIACIYCVSYIPAIAGLELKARSFESSSLLLYFLVVMYMGDMFNYFTSYWSKGKAKVIMPQLSQSKTWNGLIVSVILASLVGAALYKLTPFNVYESAAIAFVSAAFGGLGRLVMSGIKKSLKIKLWSDLLGVQGGALDKVSSMIFAAPIFYHLCRYFFN